jgi:pimeloyl-ACP methyl ester carboxylesterase
MPASLDIPLPAGGHLAGTVELTGTTGCVVFVHGFGSDRTGAKAVSVQTACGRRGWSYAAFDFRGHGGSSGTMRDLRASGLQSDLAAIRDHLASRGVRQLYLVGSSMGGFASMWFALNNPIDVPAVVLLAPAFRFLDRRWEGLSAEQREDWRASGVIRFRNQWLDVEQDHALIEERASFRMEDLADRWRTPALIFHGMLGESVPWQDTLAVVERTAFADIELRLLRDGDHRLQAYRDEMAEEACRFFERWMGASGVTDSSYGERRG